MLSAGTRLLGVIGWPVAHSLSPLIHGTALPLLGVPFAYAAFAVPPPRLPEAVLGAAALGLVGLNVTLPFKEAALSLCQPDELSLRVGAVNTLSFLHDGIHGTNTDVPGFAALCREAGAPLGPGLQVVLLGAGGAARAAWIALGDAGARGSLFSRERRRLVFPDGEVPVLPLTREALAQHLSGCDLLVDCTGRGLDPGATYPELDLLGLPARCVVLDLVVARETPLSRSAAAAGLRAATGAVMLLHQGALSLSQWIKRPVPETVLGAMHQALFRALAY